MGNDGGSIPTRRELVKEAARNPTTTELKESLKEQQEYYWAIDPISNRPLAQPVVSDCTGKLYNKDTILEFLIPSDDADRKVEAERTLRGNVKSLKDVVEVKFEAEGSEEAAQNAVGRTERWICPITKDALGASTRAVYLVPCGHAFSSSIVKEITDETCMQCNEPYAPNDVIPILPTDETDIARLLLRVKMLKEKGLTHSLKKASGKKRKKHAEADGEEGGVAHGVANGATNGVSNGHTKGKSKASPMPSTNPNIKNASTASLAAKVLGEQEERIKKRKVQKNENLDSLFSSREKSKPNGNSADFMSRGFSIPGR